MPYRSEAHANIRASESNFGGARVIEISLERKLDRANKDIIALGSVLVAFSGGVDSSLLLALALGALGFAKVLAVTAAGPVESAGDIASAKNVALLLGARHIFIEQDPLQIPEFPLNTPERCYVCRKQLYTALEAIRVEQGLAAIADGTIADDSQDYRPGSKAAAEAGVKRPLADAGLTKDEVRIVSHMLGLPTASKPASPCLASRFPYGEPITLERLQTVEKAEDMLHRAGFPIVRVRHHGTIARIEVPTERIAELAAEPLRSTVTASLRALGFAYVCVDLQGFRSGSLNEVL